jgi:hypothetical protein
LLTTEEVPEHERGPVGLPRCRWRPDPGGPLRVSAERLDSLVAAAGELLDVSGALAERPAELESHAVRVRHRRAEWRRIAERVRAIADADAHPGLHEALDAFGIP